MHVVYLDIVTVSNVYQRMYREWGLMHSVQLESTRLGYITYGCSDQAKGRGLRSLV